MDGGSYVLYINLSMAAIVAGVFLCAYLQDKRRIQALCWLGACGFVLINGTIEAVVPQLSLITGLRVLAYACFMAALGLLALGLAYQLRVKFPWMAVATFFALSMILNIAILDMERNAPLRLYLYHGPYMLMGSFSAWIILHARHKAVLEYLLLAAVSLLNLHFLLRPTAAKLLGGMGDSPQAYLSTPYAAYDQTVLAIIALALAALLSLVLVREVIRSLTKVSVTDPLSGLMNRRGFLESAQKFLHNPPATGQVIYVAVADIDYFKSINDRYGHEAGDKVIKAFGDLLMVIAADGANVARIGGEEFAIMFGAPNSAAARLYAQNIRNATELGAADKDRDLPRFTVSIGVAGKAEGEPLNALMRRADLALYRAKQDGRNRVVLAETLELSDLLVPAAA